MERTQTPMHRWNRKAMAGEVTGWIVAVGIGVIVISVIAIMLGAFQDDLVADSTEYNVTGRGLTFLDNATSKFGTAGTIVGVLFLLGVLGAGGFAGYSAYRKIRS